MTVPDLTNPVAADQIATFAGDGQHSPASKIDYDVPLPGAQPITRVVPLELPDDAFTDASRAAGTSLKDLGVVEGAEGVVRSIDTERLASLYRRLLPATARPALRLVADVGGDVEPLLSRLDAPNALRAEDAVAADQPTGLLARRQIVAEPDDVELQRLRKDSYLTRLAGLQQDAVSAGANARITLPVPGPGTSINEVQVDPLAPATPRLALVEVWELRSYLGDYGLGRTLQTFSLLPGEKTTITVETWRSEAATRDDATSIFDSSDTAAQTRFSSSLANESGAAFQDQGGWSLSVNTSASAGASLFGLVSGSASMSAGFAANHQEASQRWSSSVSRSAGEHATQVNNSRRQSVQQSSSTTSASGSATTTVRELANVNLRRVLNFVFRELNQTYTTYVVLRDIRVAFYNGRPGSVEIVPLGELKGLLDRHVAPKARRRVARALLALCAERLDHEGRPVATLEVGTRTGARYEFAPATLAADGTLDFDGDPLASDVRWRFAPGPLTEDADRPIDGVITQRSSVVLRTDNVVVEALLGQADALDPYGAAVQGLDVWSRQTDIQRRETETERLAEALSIVNAIATNSDKVDAYDRMLGDKPEIEVVPVAAVDHNGH
jgi:hypothetical protein